MTLAPNGKDYVCDLEGDDTCACSTTVDCQCIPEPVCDGPLVGTLVGLEVECADCGSPMVEVGGATAGEAKPRECQVQGCGRHVGDCPHGDRP